MSAKNLSFASVSKYKNRVPFLFTEKLKDFPRKVRIRFLHAPISSFWVEEGSIDRKIVWLQRERERFIEVS